MDAVVTPSKRARRGDRPPAPNVVVGPADEMVFQKLNQHGPLPRSLIEPFTAYLRPSERYSQNRLALLYKTRVQPNSEGYLSRPGQERYAVGSDKHEIYANTRFADEYLLTHNLATRTSTIIDDWNYSHECLLGATSASIELGCSQNPRLEYLSEHQLISRAPTGSREMPCEISHEYDVWVKGHGGWKTELRHGNASLIPDAYFAIKQELDDGPDYRAFFLEVDRGTERINHPNLNKKSWLATLLKYRHIFQHGKYKQHFGITCDAYVLVVTTSLGRTKEIQDKLMSLTSNKGSSYILFQTWPEYINKLYVPKEPRTSFITEPWQRVGKDKTGQPYTPVYLVMPTSVLR